MINDNARPWWILMAASSVLGLVVLDETVVGVALPTMRTDLAMTEVGSHWIANAYLLAFTCFLALGGKLGDLWGRGRVFPVGAGIFLLASLLAALAPSGGWLIAARGLQGIGAAITFPASMAIVTQAFPPERRGTAFGVQTTIAGCFMAAGPFVGGAFSESLSWRWIFGINVPIVAVTAGILTAALAASPSAGRAGAAGGRFDYGGLAALVAGLTGVTVGLMQSTDWGWTSPVVIISLVAGVVFVLVFVAIELGRANPLVELDLLTIPAFTGGNIVFAMFQFEKMIVFIFLALFLQHDLGRSPVEAGLVVSVAIVPTLVTSRLAGKVRDRHGARVPLTVTLVATAVIVVLIGLGTVLRSEVLIVAVLVVWGAIMPFIAVTARPALMGAVPAEKQGQASGVNLSIQMLGGTVAIAIASPLLILTGAYWPIFLMTGACTLVAAVAAWRLIDRPTA
ncbi:MFS transporter [Mycobacterium sp. CVI_P3]|uniref:MFS transporter n=1 Tax=Mycobacterium pinniadriaticum TaxID=2994102 RepID=A0ABT3SJ46_9MYCO|nr:MFS transporter [Mycobacterium pinniadriaticum]MCX2933051.1 MFS transporter [Mycobacterium pinniadriaticum]MCX2939473.1 MFS transporter [Mycobacterium pinniadriaticum]